ncbi:MAG TPA: metal-sensing transcriptional repressor, partial [Ktedonobacteraceae bacterium]
SFYYGYVLADSPAKERSSMNQERKQESKDQLDAILQQLTTLRAMIEADTACAEVLHQAVTIRHALEHLDQTILKKHLQTCVPTNIRAGHEEAMIHELLQLYALVGNR